MNETRMARQVTVEYRPLISFVELFSVTQKKAIRVGIVGANANAGWARFSHVSVINGLPGVKLAAVATRNAGVAPQDVRSSFEIRGTEGWLNLTSDHPYSFQAGDLKLTSNVSFETPEEAVVSGGLMGAAINVGEVYSHLVRDVQAGTYRTPGFGHAVHNARLIETVKRAADRGERQKVT
jgi:predicted dehydrogenase